MVGQGCYSGRPNGILVHTSWVSYLLSGFLEEQNLKWNGYLMRINILQTSLEKRIVLKSWGNPYHLFQLVIFPQHTSQFILFLLQWVKALLFPMRAWCLPPSTRGLDSTSSEGFIRLTSLSAISSSEQLGKLTLSS